ncbi:MAG: dockerin type I domain-containing protein, partial [Planctomycetota bacterium]
TGTLTRTDPLGFIDVVITSDPPGSIDAPSVVSFLPGELTSQPFTITGIDNATLDGDRTVEVIAEGAGYEDARQTITVTDLETLTFAVDDLSISEEDGVTTVRVIRTDSRGTAVANVVTDSTDDVLLSTNQVTFADGDVASSPIVVTAIDNVVIDGTRIVGLTATSLNYVDGVTSLMVTDFEPIMLSVVDGAGNPIVPSEVDEDAESPMLMVSVPAAITPEVGPITVSLRSFDRTQLSVPASVAIGVGESFVMVPMSPRDNDFVEPNRSIGITANATQLIGDAIDVTVVNDDTPLMTASWVVPPRERDAVAGQVDENGGQALLRLTRNTLPQITVQLIDSPFGGIDLPDEMSFEAGQRVLDIPMSSIDNFFADGDRTAEIQIDASLHDSLTATLNIIDDDLPEVLGVSSTGGIVAEMMEVTESVASSAPQTFFVVLSAAPMTPVTLDVINPSRLRTDVNAVTFDQSNWDVPQPVRVSALNDDVVDPDEIVMIQLSATDDSDPAFRDLAATGIPVRVINDDEAALTITPTSDGTFASELGISDDFTVVLDKAPQSTITLRVGNDEIASVNLSPDRLTFTPDNWNVPQTVTVTTGLDFDADLNELGNVLIDVLPSSDVFGYSTMGTYRLPIVHVDADLADLRVRRDGSGQLELVDATTDQPVPGVDMTGGVIRTGNRSETIRIDSPLGVSPATQIASSGGDDTLIFDSASDVFFDGGDGRDVLKLASDGARFDFVTLAGLSTTAVVRPTNIEIIDTLDHGLQTVVADPQTVRDVTDAGNELMLRIDGSDRVLLGTEWTVGMPVMTDGYATHVLTGGTSSTQTTLKLFGAATWTNPIDAPDVDFSGEVTALDALLVINRINSGDVVLDDSIDEIMASGEPLHLLDVNQDGRITALDALRVINEMNRRDASARESNLTEDRPDETADLVFSPIPDRDDDDDYVIATAPVDAVMNQLGTG